MWEREFGRERERVGDSVGERALDRERERVWRRESVWEKEIGGERV